MPTLVMMCLGLFLAACAQTAPLTPEDAASRSWLRAETPHFVIYSDEGRAVLEELAEDLLFFRTLLLDNYLPEARSLPTQPVRMLAFAQGGDFVRFVGRPDHLGVYRQTSRGAWALVDVASALETSALAYRLPDRRVYRVPQRRSAADVVLRHEYTHHIQAQLGADAMPLWYFEGLAEYLSTLTRRGDEGFRVGLAATHRLAQLWDQNWISMPLLLQTRSYETGHGLGIFYAQSWLLTHYLHSDETRRQQLGAYLRDLRAGTAEPVAFERNFGMDHSAMEARLRAYLKRGRFDGKLEQIRSEQSDAIDISRVSESEILRQQGQFLLYGFGLGARATTFLKASAQEGTEPVDVQLDLAYAELLEGDTEAAGARIESLLAQPIHRERPDVQLMGGHVQMRYAAEAASEGLSAIWPHIQRGRAFFEAVLQQEPGHVEASSGLGRSYLVGPPPPETVIEALQFARASIPSEISLVLLQAYLHERRNETQQARKLYKFAHDWAREQEYVEEARTALRRLEPL